MLAMYTQFKMAKKIESYKVLCSVTSFVQHTYKKVSVIQLRRLDNEFFYCGRRSSSCIVSVIGREGKTATRGCYSLRCGGITFHRLRRTVRLLLICHCHSTQVSDKTQKSVQARSIFRWTESRPRRRAIKKFGYDCRSEDVSHRSGSKAHSTRNA